jgi:protein SCO1/2
LQQNPEHGTLTDMAQLPLCARADLAESRRSHALLALAMLAFAFFLNSCAHDGSRPNHGTSPDSQTNREFQVRGTVTALDPDGNSASIRHEAIPDYMPAMTMPFAVRDPGQLAGLKAGDRIAFRLNVTRYESWIDQVQKLADGQGPPPGSSIRVAKDVEPLEVGDPVPNYHFTNELGAAVSLEQFKGQALAITFIFTRCPLPDFCPRMSGNFAETQKTIIESPGAPRNWRLLTISFDPEFDTPPVLKGYARRYGADPLHWSFLTGDLIEVTAIAEQFGQMFWREEGALNHNLRTVVVDAGGRVRKIFSGNKWTSAELAQELIEASHARATKP